MPLKDSDPDKYIHLKFFKEFFGIYYKSTNAVWGAELNRLPL